jgi:mono/diheme cytochrome c family protein
MSRVFKWIGLGGAIFFSLLAVLLTVVYAKGTMDINSSFSVEPKQIAVPTDAAAIARGNHLAHAVSACVGCHGDNLGGNTMIHDEMIGLVEAPNLTTGHGGVGGTYTDADFVRAIRHGVGKDGRGLLIMPSKAFSSLSDEDLGAVIAYVRSVPPVDNETEPIHIKPFGRLLAAMGAFGDVVSAKVIDHDAQRPVSVAAAVTPQYGGYLVDVADCHACHGADLSGGQSGEPGAPPAPDLTPGGELQDWTEADFITALRTGVAPGGRQLSDYMPWKEYGKMTDNELKAVWAYLRSLPGDSGN